MSVKAYVIHSKSLQLREQSMKQLTDKLKNSLNIDSEIITDYDVDSISMDEIKTFVDLNKTNKYEFFDGIIRNIHIKNVSNALKHHVALKKAASDAGKHDFYLVLEDDVLFGDDIVQKIGQVIGTYSTHKWDMIFMGLPSLSPIEDQNKVEPKLVSDTFRVLPSCDSYMMHKSVVEKISSAFLPIKFVTNIHMSYLATSIPLKLMYTSPNVFIDGSKMGVYLSSLEANNKLYLNPEYNQLNNLIRKDTYTEEDTKVINSMIENVKFKTHPDIQYLIGLYNEKCKNYAKAKDIYEAIYKIYSQNGCVVNNESELLTQYINIHKHFQ